MNEEAPTDSVLGEHDIGNDNGEHWDFAANQRDGHYASNNVADANDDGDDNIDEGEYDDFDEDIGDESAYVNGDDDEDDYDERRG